jgi:hypothetical protein
MRQSDDRAAQSPCRAEIVAGVGNLGTPTGGHTSPPVVRGRRCARRAATAQGGTHVQRRHHDRKGKDGKGCRWDGPFRRTAEC